MVFYKQHEFPNSRLDGLRPPPRTATIAGAAFIILNSILNIIFFTALHNNKRHVFYNSTYQERQEKIILIIWTFKISKNT